MNRMQLDILFLLQNNEISAILVGHDINESCIIYYYVKIIIMVKAITHCWVSVPKT